MSKVAWLAEGPLTSAGPLYAVARGTFRPTGEEITCTLESAEALQFPDEAACLAWCAEHPHPAFVPREHGWVEAA